MSPAYRAPKGTEVSTTVAGGEERRVEWKGTSPREVLDEPLAEVLERLADDEANPVRRARTDKKE